MAQGSQVELSEEVKRAIRQYLVKLAIAGGLALGVLNLVSLLTFVPGFAADKIVESRAVSRILRQPGSEVYGSDSTV